MAIYLAGYGFIAQEINPIDIGYMTEQCQFCGALFFPDEINEEKSSALMCCHYGSIQLPLFEEIPEPLSKWLRGDDETSQFVKENIRTLNSMFTLTSSKLKKK